MHIWWCWRWQQQQQQQDDDVGDDVDKGGLGDDYLEQEGQLHLGQAPSPQSPLCLKLQAWSIHPERTILRGGVKVLILYICHPCPPFCVGWKLSPVVKKRNLRIGNQRIQKVHLPLYVDCQLGLLPRTRLKKTLPKEKMKNYGNMNLRNPSDFFICCFVFLCQAMVRKDLLMPGCICRASWCFPALRARRLTGTGSEKLQQVISCSMSSLS